MHADVCDGVPAPQRPHHRSAVCLPRRHVIDAAERLGQHSGVGDARPASAGSGTQCAGVVVAIGRGCSDSVAAPTALIGDLNANGHSRCLLPALTGTPRHN